MPLSKSKLIQAARSLFKEEEKITEMIVEILLTKKLRIDFDEIMRIAEKLGESENVEDLAKETMLAMEDWRLMLPVRAKHCSIAWENRLNTPKPGETYEVSTCIVLAFNHLTSKGVWDWRLSIRKYMESIRQPNKDIVLSVIDEILRKLYFKRLTNAMVIHEACKHHDYEENIGVLIVELKGGGIISPCLGYSLISRRLFAKHIEGLYEGGPFYEINRALFILELSKY